MTGTTQPDSLKDPRALRALAMDVIRDSIISMKHGINGRPSSAETLGNLGLALSGCASVIAVLDIEIERASLGELGDVAG